MFFYLKLKGYKMYSYFSVDNLYLWIWSVLIIALFVLLMNGISKTKEHAKWLIVFVFFVGTCLDIAGFITQKSTYEDNVKVCNQNIDYKMKGLTCYKPLKSGGYVEASAYEIKI